MSQSIFFAGGCPIRIAVDLACNGRATVSDNSTVREAMATHDAIWIGVQPSITASDIPGRPKCRFIACPCTGLDHIDLEACQRAGIEVISLKGEREFLDTIHATAEHTIALMLSLLRNIPAAAADVNGVYWRRDRFCGRELHGKTIGIVGLGRVGSQVATILKAFGCEVLTCDRGDQMETVLRAADIVSLHVPLNGTTRGLIGKRELAMMKQGAVLVNTSRGGVLDESAVAAAVLSRHLAGVAVDVLDGEPDIQRSPLLAASRQGLPVLITPHIGGKTHESCEKTELFIAQKLIRALERDTCHVA